MNWINNLKFKIDSFNYLLRTTAGHGLVLLAMILVQLFSTTTFFSKLMHEGKSWLFRESAQLDYVSYCVGFLFALSLEFGIYFAAINGRKSTSAWFAFISAILAVVSFQGLILYKKIGDDLQFITPQTSIYNAEWWFILVGIMIIAVYPAVFIADVSHKLYDLYEKEGFALPEQPQKTKMKRSYKNEIVDAEIVSDDISERIRRMKVS